MASELEEERQSIQNDLSDCLGLIDGTAERLAELREEISARLENAPHIGSVEVEAMNCFDMRQSMKDLYVRLLDNNKRYMEWDRAMEDEP